jgi:hypothetical protein
MITFCFGPIVQFGPEPAQKWSPSQAQQRTTHTRHNVRTTDTCSGCGGHACVVPPPPWTRALLPCRAFCRYRRGEPSLCAHSPPSSVLSPSLFTLGTAALLWSPLPAVGAELLCHHHCCPPPCAPSSPKLALALLDLSLVWRTLRRTAEPLAVVLLGPKPPMCMAGRPSATSVLADESLQCASLR